MGNHSEEKKEVIRLVKLTPKQRAILKEAGLKGQGNLDELVCGIYTARFAIEYPPEPGAPEYFYRRWILEDDCLPWLAEHGLIEYDKFHWSYKITPNGMALIAAVPSYIQ